MEPQPLWEYPGVALTEQFKMATFDFTQKVTDTKTETQQGTVQFKMWEKNKINQNVNVQLFHVHCNQAVEKL